MSSYTCTVLQSTDELRKSNLAWDNLWQRSEVTSPLMRAEPIANWVDHFCPEAPFHGVTVEREGRLVAALPLVVRRLRPMVSVAALPNNEWSVNGDLLLDPQEDLTAVLHELVRNISGVFRGLLWLENIPISACRWTAFKGIWQSVGRPVSTREHYSVGEVDLTQWPMKGNAGAAKYWSRQRNCARRLQAQGQVRFECHCNVQHAELNRLLDVGFQVEDSSWKGREGTSILRTPGMPEFYRRQASYLAENHHLCLTFLHCNDQPIAFHYEIKGKCDQFGFKIGCDDKYRQFAPGHQIVCGMLKQLQNGHYTRRYDFGSFAPWMRYLVTGTYPVGRIVVSVASPFSRGLLHVYDRWRSPNRSASGRSAPNEQQPALA